MNTKKESYQYHLLLRIILFLVSLGVGQLLKLNNTWIYTSILALIPIHLSFLFLIIVLEKSLKSQPWIINKQVFTFLLIGSAFWIDRVPKKYPFVISLLFMIIMLLGLQFRSINNLIDNENASLAIFGFLFIGAISYLIDNLASTPAKSFRELATNARYQYALIWHIIHDFLDEKRHGDFSKMVSIMTRLSVKIVSKTVGVIYLATLGGIVGLGLWDLFSTEMRRIQFYYYYFPSNQIKEYLFYSGKFSIPIILSTVIIVLHLTFKKELAKKLYLIVLIYIFSAHLLTSVYNSTTGQIRDKVYIWSVAPDNVSEIWTDVTIKGVNFKERPFDAFVYINGIQHRVISWTDREVIFRTDPTLTGSGKLRLVNVNGVWSNKVDFTYTPPK